MKRLFAVLFFVIVSASSLFCQSADADSKMSEIESFKKFSVDRSQISGDGKTNSDSSIRIIELISYNRKKDGLGKVVQRSRYQGTEVKRTCYFNNDTRLFAIRDSIWYDNHTQRQLNYYFKNGKLASAVDSRNKNVTANINQTELFYWISSVFQDVMIN